MKFWKFNESNNSPNLKKELRILTWSVTILIAAYLLMALALAVLTWDQFMGGWVILGFFGLYGLVFLPILLSAAAFIRYCRTAKHGADIPDPQLDRALSITALTGGLTALALFLLNTLWDVEVSYPWDTLAISATFSALMIAALAVSLCALALNFMIQWYLRLTEKKHGEEKKTATIRPLRIVAVVVLAVVLLGVLLLPQPQGRYNDAPRGEGSEYYEAALYEIIDWSRAPAEGAMAVPEDFDPNEAQHTRIYFFPFNCYTYEAKWDLTH